MRAASSTFLAFIGALAGTAPRAAAQGKSPIGDTTVEQVQAALEGAYGIHAGQRRNHAKGTCAEGSFVGAPSASAYSRSSLFSGRKVTVVARFSLAGGDPNAADTDRSPRGLGLEFRLPHGSLQHMTMINTPMFFAATPRTFLDKMLALKPNPATGKPDPQALAAFAASHPDSAGQGAFLAQHNPPASYATESYYGIHTFKLIAKDGKTTLVRWRFTPHGGEQRLSDEELTSKPSSFLEKELIKRTARGPVLWDMWIAIGQRGDPEDDPTRVWPPDRKEVKAGTLTIPSAMKQPGASCERINYDPLILSDGFAPTNDPILLFRSPSYAESFARRLAGQ